MVQRKKKVADNRKLEGPPSLMISEILLIGQISERVPGTPLWRTGQAERRERKQNIYRHERATVKRPSLMNFVEGKGLHEWNSRSNSAWPKTVF